MRTTLTILRPGAEPVTETHVLDPKPGLPRLRELVEPHLNGGRLERVAVLHDGLYTDMFVHEEGHAAGLPRNEAATEIYRANWLSRNPGGDPESVPWIAGTAVLFSRRVWF